MRTGTRHRGIPSRKRRCSTWPNRRRVGRSWSSGLGEFKRVVTHPRLFNPQHSTDEACLAVRRPIVFPSRAVLCPDPDCPALLMEAAQEANAVGNRAFDAQTVAVCREHTVARLMTEDRDLDRFAGLETKRLAD